MSFGSLGERVMSSVRGRLLGHVGGRRRDRRRRRRRVAPRLCGRRHAALRRCRRSAPGRPPRLPRIAREPAASGARGRRAREEEEESRCRAPPSPERAPPSAAPRPPRRCSGGGCSARRRRCGRSRARRHRVPRHRVGDERSRRATANAVRSGDIAQKGPEGRAVPPARKRVQSRRGPPVGIPPSRVANLACRRRAVLRRELRLRRPARGGTLTSSHGDVAVAIRSGPPRPAGAVWFKFGSPDVICPTTATARATKILSRSQPCTSSSTLTSTTRALPLVVHTGSRAGCLALNG